MVVIVWVVEIGVSWRFYWSEFYFFFCDFFNVYWYFCFVFKVVVVVVVSVVSNVIFFICKGGYKDYFLIYSYFYSVYCCNGLWIGGNGNKMKFVIVWVLGILLVGLGIFLFSMSFFRFFRCIGCGFLLRLVFRFFRENITIFGSLIWVYERVFRRNLFCFFIFLKSKWRFRIGNF